MARAPDPGGRAFTGARRPRASHAPPWPTRRPPAIARQLSALTHHPAPDPRRFPPMASRTCLNQQVRCRPFSAIPWRLYHGGSPWPTSHRSRKPDLPSASSKPAKTATRGSGCVTPSIARNSAGWRHALTAGNGMTTMTERRPWVYSPATAASSVSCGSSRRGARSCWTVTSGLCLSPAIASRRARTMPRSRVLRHCRRPPARRDGRPSQAYSIR